MDPSISKSTEGHREVETSRPVGFHSETEANDVKDPAGRMVREEREDKGRGFFASLPKATENSGLHTSKAVSLREKHDQKDFMKYLNKTHPLEFRNWRIQPVLSKSRKITNKFIQLPCSAAT